VEEEEGRGEKGKRHVHGDEEGGTLEPQGASITSTVALEKATFRRSDMCPSILAIH